MIGPTTPVLLLLIMAMYPQPYFSPTPQMIPGFVPQYPIFQTPNQGQKRDSLPLSSSSGIQIDKRIRNNSGGEGSITSPSLGNNCEVTLQDVMLEFKKLATKEDLVQVKSTIIAQSAEIQQLKTELNSHHDRIKVLEEQVVTEIRLLLIVRKQSTR